MKGVAMEKEVFNPREEEEWDERFAYEDEELQRREQDEEEGEYGLDPAFSSWADYMRYMYGA